MLWVNSTDNNLMMFSYICHEIRFDNLHAMSDPVFGEKYFKMIFAEILTHSAC